VSLAKVARGRPRVPADQKKSAMVGVRMLPALRDRLKQVATSNDKSLSAEIENRLEQSFNV